MNKFLHWCGIFGGMCEEEPHTAVQSLVTPHPLSTPAIGYKSAAHRKAPA